MLRLIPLLLLPVVSLGQDLQLTDYSLTNKHWTIQWDTDTGKAYILKESTDLVNWSPVHAALGTGAKAFYSDTLQSGTFYRVDYDVTTNSLDDDADGLPDAWELAYQLSPLDNGSSNPDNGPAGNPDGDAYTNTQEYQNGSNPNDTTVSLKPSFMVLDMGAGASYGTIWRARVSNSGHYFFETDDENYRGSLGQSPTLVNDWNDFQAYDISNEGILVGQHKTGANQGAAYVLPGTTSSTLTQSPLITNRPESALFEVLETGDFFATMAVGTVTGTQKGYRGTYTYNEQQNTANFDFDPDNNASIADNSIDSYVHVLNNDTGDQVTTIHGANASGSFTGEGNIGPSGNRASRKMYFVNGDSNITKGTFENYTDINAQDVVTNWDAAGTVGYAESGGSFTHFTVSSSALNPQISDEDATTGQLPMILTGSELRVGTRDSSQNLVFHSDNAYSIDSLFPTTEWTNSEPLAISRNGHFILARANYQGTRKLVILMPAVEFESLTFDCDTREELREVLVEGEIEKLMITSARWAPNATVKIPPLLQNKVKFRYAQNIYPDFRITRRNGDLLQETTDAVFLRDGPGVTGESESIITAVTNDIYEVTLTNDYLDIPQFADIADVTERLGVVDTQFKVFIQIQIDGSSDWTTIGKSLIEWDSHLYLASESDNDFTLKSNQLNGCNDSGVTSSDEPILTPPGFDLNPNNFKKVNSFQ